MSAKRLSEQEVKSMLTLITDKGLTEVLEYTYNMVKLIQIEMRKRKLL